ncbi:Lipocalin family protein [Mycolicibacterium aurum]|uniref:Lipocalin family protein n=2 Tax=Mycolicibacterium aurum TaxID=1791 RepID=A0A3S4VMW7_MYCAU|nr:Lipocalin family protein [Mycolicibacterium aurum]
MGTGACLALGVGHGVAAADTDTSSGGDSSNTASKSGTPSAGESASQSAADQQETSTSADSADDPATVPGSTKRRGAASSVTADAESESETAAGAEVETEAEVVAGAETEADDPEATGDEPTGTDTPSGTALADVVVEDVPTTGSTGSTATSATSGNSAPAAPTAPEPATPQTDARTQAIPAAQAALPATVTGVQTGHAKLTIPVGTRGYTTRADWYLPTQADGSVAATGVIWLQHGFLGNKASMSKLAQTLSQQTNSVIVVPNISSFPLACSACWINGAPLQEAVATMFLGDRASLTASATTAGLVGALPEDFVMSGHSAGGGFATSVGGYYTTDVAGAGSLRGVVMFDGFAFYGVLTSALAKLDDPFVPVYQVAAPPQPFNSNGASTKELVAARPGQFVGATLAFGSHADAIIGGNAIFDFLAQLATGVSPAGNTQAAYTLATGWINDMYQGLTPLTGNGIYGVPDQYIVMGDTAAIVLAAPPVVDLGRYLGTWYEVGSVKQFFSIGLVNTTAVYGLNPDGSIKVENSGNYFVNNGPKATIVGSALPVDADNNKLNVRFFGAASARPPGNYWIVDLDPDYQWAVVTDPTGFSGFLLTRDPIVSADFYQELLDRASVNGVKGRITPTRQPAAAPATAISV